MSTSGPHPPRQVEVALRPMTPAEYAAFMARSDASYAHALTVAGEVSAGAAAEHVRRQTAVILPDGARTEGMRFLVAEAAGVDSPVGYLWLALHRPERPGSGWVYELYVEEHHRRRGYGRALMRAAEREAAAEGVHELGLNVFATNTAARALYASLGYQPTSIRMSKTLGPADQ